MLSAHAHATSDSLLINQLKEMVAKVRAGVPSSIVRSEAAEQLADFARRIDPKKVDDKTFADLVSLLDIPDESIRGWVAGAIGFLGPRARPAVPALLKLLPEADCLQGDLTSAGAIRLALKRIGEKPPPQPDCRTARK
jgi:hypothetical protein